MLDNILAAIFFLSIGFFVIFSTKLKYTEEVHKKEKDKYRWTEEKWRLASSWVFFIMSKSYIIAKCFLYFTGTVCIAFGLLALFTI